MLYRESSLRVNAVVLRGAKRDGCCNEDVTTAALDVEVHVKHQINNKRMCMRHQKFSYERTLERTLGYHAQMHLTHLSPLNL
mmetsp:Transcript_159492/g.306076  ORF Transcript_159492/g.306076 Transcript_159492/m.306076 type:complete len:82 (+) Transcript_159492:1459-1704(+)